VILSNYYDETPQLYNLTSENFNFFVGIQGINFNYYIDPTIYTLKIGINQIKYQELPNGEANYIENLNYIDMERCVLQKHFKNYANLFKSQELSNLLCFDQDKIKNITLAGTWGNENYQYLEFTVSNCKNGTNPNIICKPKDEINRNLEGGFFVIYYIEPVFDPKNFSRPDNMIRQDFYTTMSNKYFKEISFWMKNINYISDAGILLASEEQNKFLQTDNIKENLDFRQSDTFISVIFRLSMNRDIIKRRYLKLQDVIAQVGGFIKGIVLIIAFLNHFYSTTNFYIYLMNKLYSFENYFNSLNENNVNSKKLNYKNSSIINELNKKDIKEKNPGDDYIKSLNNQYNNSEIDYIKNPHESCDKSSNELQSNNIDNIKKSIFAIKNNKNLNNLKKDVDNLNDDNFNIGIKKDIAIDKSERKEGHLKIDDDSNSNTLNNSHVILGRINIDLVNCKKNDNDFINSNYKMNLTKISENKKNKIVFEKKNSNNLKEIQNKISLGETSLSNINRNIQEEKKSDENQISFNKHREEEDRTNNKNNKFNQVGIISEIMAKDSDEILKRIETQNKNLNSIEYNFCEKIVIIFNLIFKFICNKKKGKQSFLKKQKQFIFENSFKYITEKFDAFKYLKIYDDIDIIKNLIFNDDQINIINIINKAQLKYKTSDCMPNQAQKNSLINISKSNLDIDQKIKIILKNTHLI